MLLVSKAATNTGWPLWILVVPAVVLGYALVIEIGDQTCCIPDRHLRFDA
jgi:NAD/NADP transhydrogenase beta subunit